MKRLEATMPYRPMEPDPATEAPDNGLGSTYSDNFTDTDPWIDPPSDAPTPAVGTSVTRPAERIYRVSLRLALVVTLVACFIRLLELDPTGRIAKYLWFAGVGLAAAAACAFVAMGSRE